MDAHLRRRLDTLISRSGLNHSFSDVPIGLSEAQINRLPRTKATAIQCSGNSKFYSFFKYISFDNNVQIIHARFAWMIMNRMLIC